MEAIRSQTMPLVTDYPGHTGHWTLVVVTSHDLDLFQPQGHSGHIWTPWTQATGHIWSLWSQVTFGHYGHRSLVTCGPCGHWSLVVVIGHTGHTGHLSQTLDTCHPTPNQQGEKVVHTIFPLDLVD